MTPVRLLLNSDFSGANAFFALAAQRQLFGAAGLDVQFTPGRGAYTAARRLADEGFDAAFGDFNALVELAAQRPAANLPIAVFMAHQNAPSCITVARDGPLHSPADLAGCTVVGHASDVALRTFAVYARNAGLDATAVRIQTSDARMADLLLDMLAGRTDGVFGYISTHSAALAGAGLAADTRVRFLPYRTVCSVLYGSALMVAPRFLRESPAGVHALVHAVRAGLLAARAEPDAAIDAVLARNPTADRRIELQRWHTTVFVDMGAPPARSSPWNDLGTASDARLGAAIDGFADASGWLHRPPVARVFTQRFLVPWRDDAVLPAAGAAP